MTLHTLEQGHLKNIFSYLDKQDTLNLRLTNNKAIVKASKDKVTIYSKNHAKTQDKINLIHNNNIDLNPEETLDIIKQDKSQPTMTLISNTSRILNSEQIQEIVTRLDNRFNDATHIEHSPEAQQKELSKLSPDMQISLKNEIQSLNPNEEQAKIMLGLDLRGILEKITDETCTELVEKRIKELKTTPNANDIIAEYADEQTTINMLRNRLPMSPNALSDLRMEGNHEVLLTMMNEGYLDDPNLNRDIPLSMRIDDIIEDTIEVLRESNTAQDRKEANEIQAAFNEMVRRRNRATERNQRE